MIVRRAHERFHTLVDRIETFHSFSYGRHYDPDHIGFGDLMAINEERLAPGAGYDDHHHADVDIVTWVLEGTLAHEDSTGRRGLVTPGVAERLSAGEGVTHAERNASVTAPLRFVQMMVRSTNWAAPEYAQVEVPEGPGLHDTVPVHAAAHLLVARPATDTPVEITVESALVHVTRGTVGAGDLTLDPGDELRVTEPATLVLTGEEAEALVWLTGGPWG